MCSTYASSSPWSFWRACSSNRSRWSNGLFNSVYALAISFLHTNALSNRQYPRRGDASHLTKNLLEALAETCTVSLVSHSPDFDMNRSSSLTLLGPMVLGKGTHHLGMLDCASRQHSTPEKKTLPFSPSITHE